MTAGLPGTGIGGIFYLLMAVAMPLRELLRKVRGQGGASPWIMITLQVGLVLGIVGGIWGEVALMNYGLQCAEQAFGIDLRLSQVGMGSQLDVERAKTLTFLTAMAGFITLGMVYAFIRGVQAVLWVRRNVVLEIAGRTISLA